MDYGKVSIVLPTFNRSNMLKSAIESCLSQTYQNIELIIIDDGSIDNTKQVVENYMIDSRVKYYFQQNRGLPKSLNRGMDLATGKYITWTSDDNTYEQQAIEKMVQCLVSLGEPGFVYANIKMIFEDSKVEKYLNLGEKNRLFKGNHILACFLYSREVFEKIGYYSDDLKYVEDYDYWLRIKAEFPIIHCDQTLYTIKDHENSLTNAKRDLVEIAMTRLRNQYGLNQELINDFTQFSEGKKIYIWGTGSGAVKYYGYLRNYLEANLEGFIDSDKSKEAEKFLEYPIYSLDGLDTITDKYILIAATFFEEIEELLKRKGLEKLKDYYFLYNEL